MPRESHEDQLSRELMRLGVTSRLKGAPLFHFWEIGETAREVHLGLDKAMVAFHRKEMQGEKFSAEEQARYDLFKQLYFDPTKNPYTHQMLNEDTQTSALRRLYVKYGYEGDQFKFVDRAETTRKIIEHFHPIRWPEFNDATEWELMREVIPAMQVARAELRVYEEQRWLYDERSQRAAEVLAYRIQNIYDDQQLPPSMPINEQQRSIFEEYTAKLERGTNPRRWVQEAWARLIGKSRKQRTAE